MLVDKPYPNDTRVRNEAETLSDAGYSVMVVCLRKEGQPYQEVINGVRTYRLPALELFRKTPKENLTFLYRAWVKAKSFFGYVGEYVYFTGGCFFMSIYLALTRGFDAIHAHNPPDTLWLVALPWKLLGKKYVFDHHDVCPELYRSRYDAEYDFFARMLKVLEWVNLRFANVTIATNESYKEIAIHRGSRRPNTVFVVRNGPNPSRMQIPAPSARLRAMNKCILVYVGSLNPQDGVDYLIRALGHLFHELKRDDFHCVIIGTGDSLQDLRSLADHVKLDGHLEFTGYISDEELQQNLAAADICMDPDPASPLNNLSTWIKVMEYMAYGKAIVSFDLPETRYSARDAALYVPPNDEKAFARATAQLMDDPALRQKMGRTGRERVEKELQWSVVSRNLLAAYAALNLPH